MYSALILMVEGKRTTRGPWSTSIEKAGYTVVVAHNGKTAVDTVSTHSVDAIIFDATTMRSDGVRSCRRLKLEAPTIPIIHCRPADMLLPPAEADVCLTLPFTSRKLINRIRAILPAQDRPDQIVTLGHLTLYTGKKSVAVDGKGEFMLTPKKLSLLKLFMTRPNITITRRELMETIWNTKYMGDTRTLDVHIRWLRETIEHDPNKPKHLRTVRGQGYVLITS